MQLSFGYGSRTAAQPLIASTPRSPPRSPTPCKRSPTPSRVRILGRLRAGAASVNELAAAVEMEASAVSHQLRLLRHLGFVVGRREGRRVVYDLHDDHIAHLIDEAISTSSTSS